MSEGQKQEEVVAQDTIIPSDENSGTQPRFKLSYVLVAMLGLCLVVSVPYLGDDIDYYKKADFFNFDSEVWKTCPEGDELRVRIVKDIELEKRFVGSTESEVLAALGTPNWRKDNKFNFGSADKVFFYKAERARLGVYFDNGRVVSVRYLGPLSSAMESLGQVR